MNAQDVTLGVALLGFLGTLSVQLVNHLSSTQTKKLDTQQQQKNRDQELRKLYIAKKIEAGEAFVSRLVATIDKIDMAVVIISAMDSDGDIVSKQLEQLRVLDEQLAQVANAVIIKSGHPYLYFEAEMLEQQSGSVMPQLVKLEGRLHELQSSKDEIQRLFDKTPPSQQKDNIKDSYLENRREFRDTLITYVECTLKHRAYLVSACAAIRHSLAKYDLPE